MGARTRISLGVAILALLVPATAQAASARVRALNAAPSGTVTILVDGVARAARVPVSRESARFSVGAGRHVFTAVRGTRIVARRSIQLGGGERVTIAYAVNRGAPELRLLREPAATAGATLLRVANYASSARAVDVRVGALVVARGLTYGATTVARRIPAAVSPTGLATVSARTRTDTEFGAGQPLVLATRSVGLFVLVPRGSGARLVRLAYDTAPPTPTRQPAVTGTRRFGNVVRCDRDTWTPKSATVKRVWTVDGVAAETTTALELTTAEHAGNVIGCTVTATSKGMTTRARTTFALSKVPAPIVAPSVEFPGDTALAPSDIMTCNTGTWTVPPATFTIRWIRVASGQQIGSGPIYTLSVPADNGLSKTLACEVVATSDGGASAAVRSVNTVALGIPPTVAIVPASKPSDPTESKDAFFTWTIGGGGADTVECSIDGNPFVACIGQRAQTYHLSVPGASGAAHTFAVRVTNPVATATDGHPWTIVPLRPTVTINPGSVPSDHTTNTFANFAWTLGGGAATVTCNLDTGPVPCAPLSGLTTDADGISHTFTITATNANPATPTSPTAHDSYPWTVWPPVPAVISLAVTPGDGAATRPFTLTFNATAPIMSATCRLDTGTFDPCTTSQPFGDPGATSHTITVIATNVSGSSPPTDISWTFVP